MEGSSIFLAGFCVLFAALAAFLLVPAVVNATKIPSRGARGCSKDTDFSLNFERFMTALGFGHSANMRRRLERHISPMKRRDAKRLDVIRTQLPSAFRAIASSICAGQSNQQAFVYVASTASEPIATELRMVVSDMQAGKSFSDALEGLAVRVPLEEVRMLCAAFAIQQRTGGSLQPIIQTAIESVRDSFEFQRTLQVQTAQARLSVRITGLLPLFLLGAILLVSPGYLTTLFTTPVGLAILSIALALDGIGFMLIKRIVSLPS